MTKWVGYIPTAEVNNLAQYVKTPASPLYNQTGIPGELAAQLDASYPLVGSETTSTSSAVTNTKSTSSDTKRRDAIIGVCVGVGGALWIALVIFIYRRVKSRHEADMHKRLSTMTGGGAMAGGGYIPEGRHSRTSSVAASEIDDRPSSFYANPAENEPSMRERRQTQATSARSRYDEEGDVFGDEHSSPDGRRAIGSTWFRSSTGSHQPNQYTPENPFADIVHRSYLDHGPNPTGGMPAWRRSAQPGAKPINKRLIGNPTLQANSLEFTEYR